MSYGMLYHLKKEGGVLKWAVGVLCVSYHNFYYYIFGSITLLLAPPRSRVFPLAQLATENRYFSPPFLISPAFPSFNSRQAAVDR